WGEALSYTGGHHYPMQQDISSARKALVKLAATRADRLAKAPTERERGYLNAVELLYGEGDGQERAQRYASAMGMLSERFPDDDEAATLHALALMRTARRGKESTRVDLQAGAIALRVFRRNGNHPGAVHYIVHAFDEPTRAIVGLEAAVVYAYLPPDPPHGPAHERDGTVASGRRGAHPRRDQDCARQAQTRRRWFHAPGQRAECGASRKRRGGRGRRRGVAGSRGLDEDAQSRRNQAGRDHG